MAVLVRIEFGRRVRPNKENYIHILFGLYNEKTEKKKN